MSPVTAGALCDICSTRSAPVRHRRRRRRERRQRRVHRRERHQRIDRDVRDDDVRARGERQHGLRRVDGAEPLQTSDGLQLHARIGIGQRLKEQRLRDIGELARADP